MGAYSIISIWTGFFNTEVVSVSGCYWGSTWCFRLIGEGSSHDLLREDLTWTECNHFDKERVCLICSTCYYRSTEAFFLSWIFDLPVWSLKLKKTFSFWLIICMLASASLIVSSNFFLVLCLMVLVSLNFRLMVKVWINQWTVSKMIGG